MSNVAVEFTPKADDTFAVASPTDEYAMVKQSSGYLSYVGIGDGALAHAKQYSEDHGGRVIVVRTVGTVEWFVLDTVEVEVPDTLPENFA